MAGFDLSELLPFYLDETDEQIAALNDALLKLEREPSDTAVLRDAFRLIHSIKGASAVLGFDQVKNLTHHLETYFDQLRNGTRVLDRATLDLSFRCLDGLRDFHRELRSGEPPTTDLTGLTAEVIASLKGEAPAAKPAQAPAPPPPPEPAKAPVPPPVTFDEAETVLLTVVFVPNLPWPDLKAKLVLNRLGSKGKVVATEPTAEQLDAAESIASFKVWVSGEPNVDVLKQAADVEGVQQIVVEHGMSSAAVELPPAAEPGPEPRPEPEPEPAPPPPTVVAEAPPAPPPPAVPAPVAVVSEPAPGPVAAGVPAAAPAQSQAKKVGETLRVDVDRLDGLMNLAGELVINRARFFEITQGLEELYRNSNARLLTADTQDRLDSLGRELDAFEGADSDGDSRATVERWGIQVRRLCDNFAEIRRELDLIRQGREWVTALGEAIHQLARISDGMQKGVLDTRMVPIGPLFDRFHRVVRDLRHSSGKEVNLVIDGEKTELDKRMIDELGDPLIHMVRNAVDHGLESPEARVAAGKPREGTISLAASHRGNSVIISVSDDGKGIGVDRLRSKIVEKGLIGEEDARRLTDRQLIQYIWHPGLSTAEKVTDISGRGVGMDIVKARIESLSGSVEVRSEPGAGTTFMIRLPLTLAILPCLLVRITSEAYAIPLDHIDEIVEVEPSQVFHARGKRMIEIRGKLISMISLDDVLTWSVPPKELEGNDPATGKTTVVVAHNGETTIGLCVDHLIGMQEVVLKPIEKNFRSVPTLAGASILGDGQVSLILDIDAVIDLVAQATPVTV